MKHLEISSLIAAKIKFKTHREEEELSHIIEPITELRIQNSVKWYISFYFFAYDFIEYFNEQFIRQNPNIHYFSQNFESAISDSFNQTLSVKGSVNV